MVRSSYALQGAQVGIYLKATDTGHVLFAKDPDVPRIPASNFKLITTAVALATLGPNFSFETQLLGPPPDPGAGTLQGNLLLRGNGDPTWVEPWTRPATGPLETFARILAKRGIRRVTGAVIADDSAFDRDFVGRGWRSSYLLLDYAPETAALSLNGNVCHLQVRADGVTAYPPTSVLHYQRRDKGSGGPSVVREADSNSIVISNVTQSPFFASLTFHNPPLYVASTFSHILKDHKILVDGGARLVAESDLPLLQTTMLYGSHRSMPLLKILKRINKDSDNLFAQHVFKAIGWKATGKGNLASTTQVMERFLRAAGIDIQGLLVADGCGLSVLNRVTPRQFAELLETMARRPDARLFKSTLSVAGKDGTLSYRMHDLQCIGKTGTIDGACSLSGYLTTHAGQQVVFSILVNHHRSSNDAVRAFQDALLRRVAACGQRL